VPLEDKPRYRNQKGEITTNVLTVCSQDMQFIYVLPGWEGSVADGKVLRNAISRRNGLRVPHGKRNGLSSKKMIHFFIYTHCTKTITKFMLLVSC
jgi:hypothetical protein